MKLRHQLPEIYREFFPKSLLEAELHETKANCEDCSMSRPNRGAKARLTYEPNLKCCTYEPFVPNFMVGAILANAKRFPAAAETLRLKIQNREYALPIGMVPAPAFQVEFNHRKSGEFGNRADWLCPYFQKESNNCGIWKYRGAVCTTFFCQSDRGEKGMRFWRNFSSYLSYAEMALLEEVLVELDFSPRQMSELLGFLNCFEASKTELKSRSISESQWKKLWNGYDNPEDFYLTCFAKVSSWNRERFAEAIGQNGEKVESKLLRSLTRMLEVSP